MKSVAIVGAGIAGLAAAQALIANQSGIVPVVFEKSRGVGGRAATRRIDGFCFDHGAQYVKAPTPELHALIAATGDAVTIDRPVWTFTSTNQIAPGDPAFADEQKWTWPGGITRLAKYLLPVARCDWKPLWPVCIVSATPIVSSPTTVVIWAVLPPFC